MAKSSEAQPRIVKWPSDEETKAAFEAYTLALGKWRTRGIIFMNSLASCLLSSAGLTKI